MYLFGTARFATILAFSAQGEVFEGCILYVYYHPSLGACAVTGMLLASSVRRWAVFFSWFLRHFPKHVLEGNIVPGILLSIHAVWQSTVQYLKSKGGSYPSPHPRVFLGDSNLNMFFWCFSSATILTRCIWTLGWFVPQQRADVSA